MELTSCRCREGKCYSPSLRSQYPLLYPFPNLSSTKKNNDDAYTLTIAPSQNPEDKREIICDEKFSKIMEGQDRVTMFTMNKFISAHLLEKLPVPKEPTEPVSRTAELVKDEVEEGEEASEVQDEEETESEGDEDDEKSERNNVKAST